MYAGIAVKGILISGLVSGTMPCSTASMPLVQYCFITRFRVDR